MLCGWEGNRRHGVTLKYDSLILYLKNLNKSGVPEGGILSTTLFILIINNITNCLAHDIENFLYVDDFVICFRSKFMHIAERKLQLVLNKLTKWVDCNGFIFSKDKTCVVHFCNQRKLNHHFSTDSIARSAKRRLFNILRGRF